MNIEWWHVVEGLAVAFFLWAARKLTSELEAVRANWTARAEDLDAVKRALLGVPEDTEYGLPASPGLVDQVQQLRQVVGSNGGSTVFDGLDVLKANQRTLMAWAEQHTAEGNAVAEGMRVSSQRLTEALAGAGIRWEPAEQSLGDFSNVTRER